MTSKSICLFAVLAAIFFSVSCSQDPECNQEIPYNVLTIGFYENEEFEKEEVSYDQIKAEGSDSVLYTKEDVSDNFSFILNPASNRIKYNFVTGVRKDFIELSYSRQLTWLSEACGPNFYYDQLAIVDHSFDSVRLLRSEFDFSINENIRIYN